MASTDNKRVAKNAIALTFRMVLITIVGLFTSRIVLQALGVDDYGIYGVIGGVVGMASFLNTSMSGATSRFITYELGKNNVERLKVIFSSALIIHFAIAIFVAILAETVGLWFVNNRMNFPTDRMFAVNVIYQFTILSMFVSFTQVPYTADIIAHEKMNIYAYIEIANVLLKLLIVYLLLIIKSDRLIFYAGLLLVTNITIAIFYRFYCSRNFKESHISLKFDKSIIKEMLKFSSMDLYGNICVVAKTQGQPIILNIFYGVIANAAASIALTVTGAVSGLTSSILQAFRPQIIKQYALGRIEKSETLAKRAIQFALLAFSIIATPLIIEAPSLITLWLGQIPLYSVIFIRIIILSSLINVIVYVNNTCIHATGNIKNVSLINGTFFLLCPIISYFYLKIGGNASSIYVIDAMMLFLIAFMGIIFIYKQIPNFNITDYYLSIIKSLIVFILSWIFVSLIMYFINMHYNYPLTTSIYLIAFIKLAICSLISIIVVSTLYWCIVFGQEERTFIRTTIYDKLKNITKK